MSQREEIGVACPDIVAVPKYPARRRRKNYLSVKIQTRQTLIAVTPNQMLHTSSRSPRVSVKDSPVENARTRRTQRARTQRARTHTTRTHARNAHAHNAHARTQRARTQHTRTQRTHETHTTTQRTQPRDARTHARVSTCKLRFRPGWKAKRTP
jgi:hypothetical protein